MVHHKNVKANVLAFWSKFTRKKKSIIVNVLLYLRLWEGYKVVKTLNSHIFGKHFESKKLYFYTKLHFNRKYVNNC